MRKISAITLAGNSKMELKTACLKKFIKHVPQPRAGPLGRPAIENRFYAFETSVNSSTLHIIRDSLPNCTMLSDRKCFGMFSSGDNALWYCSWPAPIGNGGPYGTAPRVSSIELRNSGAIEVSGSSGSNNLKSLTLLEANSSKDLVSQLYFWHVRIYPTHIHAYITVCLATYNQIPHWYGHSFTLSLVCTENVNLIQTM